MISHQMITKRNQEQVSTPIKSEDLNFQSERSQIIVKEAQIREEETFQRQENQEEKVGQVQKGEQLGIQIQNTSQQSLIQDKVKKTQQMIDQTSKIVVKQAEIISESVKIIERQQIKESVKQQMKITQQNIVSKVIQQIKEKQPQIPQILIIPEVQAKDQSINKPLQEQRLQEQRLQKKDVSIIKIQTNVKIIQQIIKNPSESAQKTQLIKVQEKAPAVILSKKIQEKSPEVIPQQKIQEKSPSLKDKKQDIQVGKQVKQQEKKEPMIDHIKIQEERQKKKQLLQSKKKENLQQLDNQKKLQKLSALQAQQQQEKPPVVRRIQKKANNKQEQPEKSQKQQQQVVKKGKNKQQKPKKKKKKYIPHEKQKEQQKQIYKKQPSTAQQIGLPKPNPDKRNIPQNISAIKKQESIVSVHIIEEQVMSQSIKMVPILTSSMIIIQAQKERVGTTYKLFLKYLHQYDRTVSTHLRIIKNVQVQMQKKKNKKQILMKLMTQYFENYSTLNRQFYQSSSKIQAQARPPVANKFISIRDQLKPHYEQLNNMRKTVANNCNRIDLYINNTVLVNIAKVFQAYFSTIMSQESRHQERRQQYINRQSIWRKTISQIDKNFNKGLQRKQKEDLFKEIARMINEEKNHREYLKLYGRGLTNLRKISIQSQKQLFDKLQQILARYKQESKVTYSVGNQQFNNYFDFINIIKTKNSFEQLCTLVDADYIKYVLQIHNKKEIKELTNKVFQDYLQLEFFDKVVGNIKNLYKGAINKIFPLQREHEELIHTISGNLVYFDREKDLCHDKYAIKNVNAKIIAPGEVQFDQIIKGFIFDDNRTARLKLKDIDRAQELICYLNEKEDNIVIESIRKI